MGNGDMNAGNIFLSQPTQRHSGITAFDVMLKDAIDTLDLKQLIIEPTRVFCGTHNLRDLFFISKPDIITDSGVLSSFSNIDHFPIFATLNINKPLQGNQQKNVWDYKNLDPVTFTRLLQQADWNSALNLDVDQAANKITSIILDAAKAAIPQITVSANKTHKPWMTTDLKRNIRKRDRLFKLARQRQGVADWSRWRAQRNYVTHLNKCLKNEHIHKQVNLLIQSKHTPFKYHKVLKSVIGHVNISDIPPLIDQEGNINNVNETKANIFNDYFASQSSIDVGDHEVPTNDPDPERPPVPTLDQIIVTELEVLKALNALDPNKSCGPDELPNRILKMTALIICDPLTKLFNKSLAAGIFPSIWKEAHVHPIFKNKGSPSTPTNYRPISLLPCLSKVFERIVHNHIYEHLTVNSLLTSKQSGYRPGHSTQLQLIYLTHNIYHALDKGEDFTAVYLDISKYFDKIWHRGLLNKCEKDFGITGSLLCWLKTYLQDRHQKTRVGDKLSTSKTINAGCPQGSVLGPLLALIYLNKLSERTTNDMLHFADDTSLYAPHKPPDQPLVRQSLQTDLNSIYEYGKEWLITFNASKTIQQTFSTKPNTHAPKLTFDGNDIPLARSHKHLGLTFSQDLHFHDHVNAVVQKVNRALSPIYPVAKYLPRSILAQIYNIYIQPHFDYCDSVYDGHITAHDAHRLQVLQNRAARLITGAYFRTSTTKLLHDVGWLPLHTRRALHKLDMYYRLQSDDPRIPNCIKNLLPNTRLEDTGRPLRNAGHQTLPRNYTSLYQKSFIPHSTRHWNILPEYVRLAVTNNKFKTEIRKHMCEPKPPHFYSFGSKLGNILHTRLRVGNSNLNAHLYTIQKSSSPQCMCQNSIETTKHFILQCHLHQQHREILFTSISDVLNHEFSEIPTNEQLDILIFGKDLNDDESLSIATSFQKFLIDTKRFFVDP